MEYITILKRIIIIAIIILLIYISAKLFMFYIPFLIAYIFSLIFEPIIKFVCRKTTLSRKTSSIIVLAISFTLLIAPISWGVIRLITESTHLLGDLNNYLDNTISWINQMTEKINNGKIAIPDEIKNLFQSNSEDILNKIIEFIQNILNKFLNYIKSIPKILVYSIITVLATYFITSDKFYILDRLEHHIPKKILGKLTTKLEKITKSLGAYLKAQIIMISISFIIVLMGLNIFYLLGMNVGYPLLMAIFIGFVDALPILGSGTVMIPWSIILFLNNEYSVGFSILGLYVFILAVRQFLEPKIVSKKIGIHPIFTLIAMYTGFKFLGVLGILIGPIGLIILKDVFENTIDRGIVKTILDT